MTKRGYLRLFSYAIAFALLLSSRAIINMTTANSYKAQLELNYQQSLNELSENLDSIETNLTKSIYSNSDKMLMDIAERLDAAQFAFAYDEILAAFGVLEDRSEGCKRDHIAGVAVRCAADNLIDIAVAGIDPADGKMVGIRVFLAAENFCDDNAGGDLSAPGDFFDFESRHCKCVCKFFGSGLEFDIIFQPVQ